MEILAVLAPDGADPVRAETRRSFAILDETVPPIGPLPTDRTVREAGAADGELRQLPPARGRRPRFPTDARGNHTLPAARMDSHLRTPSRSCTHAPVSCAGGPALMPVRPEDHSGGKPWFDWQANFSLRQRLPLLPVAGMMPLGSSSGPRRVPCRHICTMTTLPVT